VVAVDKAKERESEGVRDDSGDNGLRKRKRGIHPSNDIFCSDGTELVGKKIVLCITASVAAYRAIDFARLLIRHGAQVHAVMTEQSAEVLLSPQMMKWATGNDVVTKLSGNLEHVMLADYGMSDLVIVYPCTANTIGKMANGIDDTPVTSVLSIAAGSGIPIIIAPAMHEAMYRNRFILENISRLKQAGIRFIEPEISEGKAKLADPEDALATVISITGSHSGGGLLSGRQVLVTSGNTVEYIDPIRVITNLSSGKMGSALAEQAALMGARVTLVSTRTSRYQPDAAKTTGSPIRIIQVETSAQMRDTVISELSSKKHDIAIMAAAVADFAPASKSAVKIDTKGRKGRIQLSLVPTEKIVDQVKHASPQTFLVAFKADYCVPDSVLIEKAFNKLQESSADLVVANDVGRKGTEIGSDKNKVILVDKSRKVVHIGPDSKTRIAGRILEIAASHLSKAVK